MTWPISDVNSSNVDAGTDKKQLARADFFDLITKFNQIRNHVSNDFRTFLGRTKSQFQDDLGIATVAFNSFGNEQVAFNIPYIFTNYGGIFNHGPGWTPGTGIFVAPVTGIYQFSWSVELYSTDPTKNALVELVVNSATTFSDFAYATGSVPHNAVHTLRLLTAGDVVKLKGSNYGNGATFGVSRFAGCLLRAT